jgi:hypothetical protein
VRALQASPETVRARVRIALADAVRDSEQWSASSETQRRNRLLDAVGSDHRPLVDLLLFAEERGVTTRLPAETLEGDRWELVHAHTALDLAARTFVHIDAARWAVEAWAFALGRIAVEQLERAVREPERDSVVPTGAAVARPAGETPRRSAAVPASSPVVARSAPLFPAAATQIAHRILPPGPRWRTNAPPSAARHLASSSTRWTVEPAAVFLAVLLLIGVPALLVLTGAVGRPSVSRATPVSPPAVARDTSTTATQPVADAVQSVAAVDASTARVAAEYLPTLVRARGIGGQYRLRVVGVEVTGSPSCDAVARRISGRPESVETISHLPGEERFTFVSRGGLVGHLTPEGTFSTDVARGSDRGVQWTVQLSGTFAGDSLIAVSDSETTGVLRWRDTQVCRALTRLVGRRLDGEGRR